MRPPSTSVPPRAAALCALVVLAAVAPATARAQFGRLGDVARAAARGAAGRGTAAAGAEARPARVAFSDSVVESTAARLDQLARGLDAEAAARPAAEREQAARVAAAQAAERAYPARLAAWEREHAAWERRKRERDACVDTVARRHAGTVEADRAQAEAAAARTQAEFAGDRQARLKALGERARAAQARGDQAAMMALADSAQRIMANEVMPVANLGAALAGRAQANARVMAADAARCGALPAEPRSPARPPTVDEQAVAAAVRAAGQAASGLGGRPYAVLRERVEEYVRRGGRTGDTPYRFTAGELAALRGRLAALQANGALLADPSWTADRATGW
jgi:hypothetical protein